MRDFLKLIFGTLIDVVSDRLRARRERKKQEQDRRESEALSYKTAKENAQYHADQAARIRGAAEKEMEHRP